MNTEEVAAAAGKVKTTAEQIRSLLETLNGNIVELEAVYTSPDGQALQGLFAEYHAQAVPLNTSLEEIGTAMDRAVQNANSMVEANTAMFSGR